MEFNLITLLALAAALVVGAVIGVGLGRRSKTANAAYDQIRERAERAEAQLREVKAKLKNQ